MASPHHPSQLWSLIHRLQNGNECAMRELESLLEADLTQHLLLKEEVDVNIAKEVTHSVFHSLWEFRHTLALVEDEHVEIRDWFFELAETHVDVILMRHVQRGDVNAFGELVKRHGKRIYHSLESRVYCHHHREDLVQQTFFNAWANAETFAITDFEPFPINRWLSGITGNLVYDHIKKMTAKKRKNETLVDPECFSFPMNAEPTDSTVLLKSHVGNPQLENWELQEFLNHQISRLPDLQREVLQLYWFQNLSREIIGKMLDLHPMKVWRILKKARKALDDMIKTDLE